MILRKLLSLCVLLLPSLAYAHVGSPDIYVEGKAGPYQLFVTIRPPAVIPGVAELEIHAETAGIQDLTAVPLPLGGPGGALAPVPDRLQASKDDPQFFTGSIWMMEEGSWQVRLTAGGSAGHGTVAIPVPTSALTVKTMRHGLEYLLTALMSFLILGAVAMAGASVREAKLEPGLQPSVASQSKGRRAMLVAFGIVLVVLWLGNRWWTSEDAGYRADLYKPVVMAPVLQGSVLTLNLTDPGWLASMQDSAGFVDGFVPDHNHLMHLYAVRQPGLDVIYHLHPDLVGPDTFRLNLPSMPAGTYKLYADVVHKNGFPETMVSTITVSDLHSRALAGDDAAVQTVPWSQQPPQTAEFVLPDGYKMRWTNAPATLKARQAFSFQFALLGPAGKVPQDMAFYMGMLGHAAFLKTDGSVFAHIHPNGTAAMSAYMIANPQQQQGTTGMQMQDMQMATAALPNAVAFPYGLPTPGRYRIVVQMKHGTTIETAVFNAVAS